MPLYNTSSRPADRPGARNVVRREMEFPMLPEEPRQTPLLDALGLGGMAGNAGMGGPVRQRQRPVLDFMGKVIRNPAFSDALMDLGYGMVTEPDMGRALGAAARAGYARAPERQARYDKRRMAAKYTDLIRKQGANYAMFADAIEGGADPGQMFIAMLNQQTDDRKQALAAQHARGNAQFIRDPQIRAAVENMQLDFATGYRMDQEGQKPSEADLPSKVDEFNWYVEQERAAGREPPGWLEYLEMTKDPGQTINIGPNGEEYGDPGEGLVWQRGPDGTVKLDERGAPIAIPYQGGKVWQQQEAADEQAAVKGGRESIKNDVVLQDLTRALVDVARNPYFTTGPGAQATGWLWGTPAANVADALKSVRSNVGFDQLQQMREASPTGGALGPVSDAENALLQSVLGSVEQSQTSEQLIDNLKRLKNTYLDIVHGPGNGPRRETLSFARSDEWIKQMYGPDAQTATGPNGEKVVFDPGSGMWIDPQTGEPVQ